ncbi:MAG TPA: alpha/beta hydrolase [Pseudomonadales bacterium]|jgi:pimeloyl-ACP methyl ester carboxylesterase|nr:alpha/beta hydrolase [Pseudomonadales bacterium]HMW14238.1 alpha/beta hydrolase [Pseudomonadales bacterium]HMW82757.1 alpha/beta hydrolase [Pseudomonadales bacterium]HMY96227.1 alpha/beta hydrolase [Pseudomonadales bacterium]HMZ70744.1 alpha/beta hydrolase [Pseudomonadales bacterium]
MRDCPQLAEGTPFTHLFEEETLTLRGNEWLQRPERPILHFLHGVAFCGHLYWPYLRELLPDCQLCLHDLEGHGASDRGQHYAGWRRNVDRLAEVIAARGWRQPGTPLIGGGHSYGAGLTLILAAEQPELFDALILLDPMIMPQAQLTNVLPFERNPAVQKTLRRRRQWQNAEQARDFLRDKPAFADWTQQALDSFIDHNLQPEPDGSLTLRCDPVTEAQVLADPLVTIWEHLQALRVPTFLLHGNDPRSPIPQNCQKAASLNPVISAIEIEGGHNFMQERPAEVAALTRQLLEQLGH